MFFFVEKDEKNENFDVSVIFRYKFICMEFLFDIIIFICVCIFCIRFIGLMIFFFSLV